MAAVPGLATVPAAAADKHGEGSAPQALRGAATAAAPRWAPLATPRTDDGDGGKQQPPLAHSASGLNGSGARPAPRPGVLHALAAPLRWLLTQPASYAELCAPLPARSLLLLSKTNPLRRGAIRLVASRPFDAVVLGAIAANCACLALASNAPGFDESPLGLALARADLVFLGVFGGEMVAKWVAYGVVAAPGTYFRDGELGAGS